MMCKKGPIISDPVLFFSLSSYGNVWFNCHNKMEQQFLTVENQFNVFLRLLFPHFLDGEEFAVWNCFFRWLLR